MCTFDDELAALVDEVKTTFGVSVTLKYTAPGAWNTTTGKRTETVTTQTWLANRTPSVLRRTSTDAGVVVGQTREYIGKASDVTLNSGVVEPFTFRLLDGSTILEVVEVNHEVNRKMIRLVCTVAKKQV
jgi:ribosomal protein S19E (S16A)